MLQCQSTLIYFNAILYTCDKNNMLHFNLLLPTMIAGNVYSSRQHMPSLCFHHSIFWTDWPLNLSFLHVRRSSGIERQGHRQGQGLGLLLGLSINWRPWLYVQMSRHQLRASAERRAAESSACGLGNAVGLTSILDRGQLFSSFILYLGVSVHFNGMY